MADFTTQSFNMAESSQAGMMFFLLFYWDSWPSQSCWNDVIGARHYVRSSFSQRELKMIRP